MHVFIGPTSQGSCEDEQWLNANACKALRTVHAWRCYDCYYLVRAELGVLISAFIFIRKCLFALCLSEPGASDAVHFTGKKRPATELFPKRPSPGSLTPLSPCLCSPSSPSAHPVSALAAAALPGSSLFMCWTHQGGRDFVETCVCTCERAFMWVCAWSYKVVFCKY